jgi:regulator of protease activity HflC (stomatin/prohibitin superfamily)
MAERAASEETSARPAKGATMLAAELVLFVGACALMAGAAQMENPALAIAAIAAYLLFFLLLIGFFIVDPNVSRALVLFGTYKGTVRESGFYWTNPFMSKRKVSLRANNFNSERLKVNDLLGNPIEIAAVVVWQVQDTARALFDVERFEQFVQVQSESAVRMVTSRHPYDDGQAHDVRTTLRGSGDEVAAELQIELQHRLDRAGIAVIEARLSHLAYASEIAAAMLQRQQASAVIAARAMIVDGAVGMVEMALQHLGERNVVELDAERRATLVGNLLVVLCSHSNPTPVLNTGSLYN